MELAEISRKAVELLLERKITVSLAESCTGGMIASALVDWPGVSEALLEGCVCYTCLLYTSPSPRDPKTSRMPSSA